MTETDTPERFGHYIVEATLGRGAMGTVYLARDERIGRRVALKKLRIDGTQFEDSEDTAEFYMRLQREAEVCGSLQHPNIVTLYDVGYEGERIAYLALEYIAGETLLDLIKRHRPASLPVDLALRIAADILRGLAYAHGRGIVHRDIKPANILIGHDGIAKIADFGIARPAQSSMTAAGALIGTPNYMPPEQVKGTMVTPRSDLFSLGVLLFEMVTGMKPFSGGEMASILEKIVRMPTPSAAAMNANVSPELDAVIQRLTAKSPEQRFASAAEALEAIERLRVHAPSAAQSEPTQRISGEGRSTLRRRVPAAVFVAVVLAMIAATAIPVYLVRRSIDATQGVQLAPSQLQELAQKREALRAADKLYRDGEYQKSLDQYETYLARYPNSAVARDGAERARLALQDAKRDAAMTRPKQQPEKTGLIQGIKRRVKRLFGKK